MPERSRPDSDVFHAPVFGQERAPWAHRGNEISRQSLMQRFRDAAQYSLVVLHDIAGSGKTMAARQWSRECQIRGDLLCWLTLEPDSNDLNPFLLYLTQSLKSAGLPLDIDMSVLVRSSPVPPLRIVLDTLLQAVAGLDRKTTIILDDLQIISGDDVKQAINWLVEHSPPNLQIIVTTREAPPFKMPRLRATGQVYEFPRGSLRFSTEEIRDFLGGALGRVAPSSQQLEQIQSATNGWPVALQFMVIAARQSEDGEVKILPQDAAKGLFSFLREDVLARLPDKNCAFLVNCAILPVLDAEVCNFVLSQSDSGDMLNWLERQHFLAPADEGSYRFCHPLLLEFLRDEQKALEGSQIASLHAKASAYFETLQDYPNAIKHALRAGDVTRAVGILKSKGMELVQASRIQELKAWLEILPDAVLEENGRLELFWIWVLFHTPQAREALKRMATLLRSIKRGELNEQSFDLSTTYLDTELRVLSAGVLSANGRSALARQTALASLKSLQSGLDFHKGTLCNILSYSEVVLGDVTAAKSASQLGIEHHRRQDAVFGVTYSELLTAVAEIEIGEPFKAEHTLRRGRDFVVEAIGHDSYAEALLAVAECEVKYWWNQCDAASEILKVRFPLVEQSGTLLFVLTGGILLARLAAARGDRQQALAVLDDLDAGDSRRFPLTMRHCLLDEKVRLFLLSGDLISANVAIRSAGLEPNALSDINTEQLSIGALSGHLAIARLCIAESRFAEALRILKVLEADAIERERNRSLLTIRGLISIALWKAGSHLEATDTVLSTLGDIVANSVVRVFLDLGADMLEPLNSAREKSKLIERKASLIACCSSLIRALEAEFGKDATGEIVSASMPGDNDGVELIEPLTDREHEIALLLADGMTNAQVSNELSVSVDTVKWHLKNLFQKLGVSNRTQAVIALTGQKSFLSGEN